MFVSCFFVLLFCVKESFCLNLTNHGNEVEHLKQLVQQLNASLQHNVIEIDRLKKESASLKATLTASSKDPVPIAFTARLSSNMVLSNQQTVIFDNVLLNLGNAYHETYGHFTAPVSGVYQFAVSLLTGPGGSNSYFAVLRNGNQLLGSIYIVKDYYSSSVTVTAHLDMSDVVFVRADSASKLDAGYYCAFSGFLIQ
ncbi:complement C1q-like protein 4 [Ostrea edulis]|uniref:complement C1q-like protein 4 n=1 Tax=Ostrea edulis TaxID=37623 RepID=UPI0020940A6B|nr:complement C1q-like protein 4 [Ostrea edulis]